MRKIVQALIPQTFDPIDEGLHQSFDLAGAYILLNFENIVITQKEKSNYNQYYGFDEAPLRRNIFHVISIL